MVSAAAPHPTLPVWEVKCALTGCRWRVLLPACSLGVAEYMARAGWQADDETEGFICPVHCCKEIDA